LKFKILLIIAVIISVIAGTGLPNAFAYNVEYEVHSPRIFNTPLVCIIIPDYNNEKLLSENYVDRIITETKVSIEEWEFHLKSQAKKNKDNWDIEYIRIQPELQNSFDYEQCQIFIHFEAKPLNSEDWIKILGDSEYELGDSGRTNIVIYYQQIGWCASSDASYYYYEPCYSDKTRITQQIGSIVRHELGHAFGLGHYVSDNNELNLQWAKGKTLSPSIMVIFSHENARENKIKLLDIEKVFSLYGSNGFKQISVPQGFEFLAVSKSSNINSNLGNEILTVSGNLTKSIYMKGHPVIVKITKPDNTIEEIKSSLSDDGILDIKIPIESDSLYGIYKFKAYYLNYESEEITFELLEHSEEEEEYVEKIPEWVKNTAKWWSMGSISDHDFIFGIQYLIKNDIIQVQPPQQRFDSEQIIPDWVKTTAGWWADGQLPEKEFLKGIQFLLQHGIIHV